ncbi:hypothetical protein BLA55_02185 [Mycoplasmopsis pullorum]|uniref:Uncharacterized protein n=1 Tax=Mycoplasmopsis pullorum TaxID=48003 RepID=A0A1L4FS79_9BACT|nr:hypothetical protein BLA55_02185 [Mycoplasmopsis pullorum]
MKKLIHNRILFIILLLSIILVIVSFWFLFDFKTRKYININVQKNELGFFVSSSEISEGIKYRGIYKSNQEIKEIEMYFIKHDKNLYKIVFLESLNLSSDNFVIGVHLEKVKLFNWIKEFLFFN